MASRTSNHPDAESYFQQALSLRIKWPADVEFEEEESFGWIVLKPSAFNRDIHLGWRFAASELQRMEEAVAATSKSSGNALRKRSKNAPQPRNGQKS